MSPHNAERWFRLLLRFYPRDFREEMGEVLVQTYLDRTHEEPVARVCFAALRDSLLNGIGERLRPAVAWRRHGDWGRDMQLVSRRLRQKPLFLATVLGTLTVGLGTFAIVYTAVDKLLLEPLPYRDPQDLYSVWEQARNQNSIIPGPPIAALQKAGGVIEGAAAFRTGTLTLPAVAEREAIRITEMEISANLFDLLGVRPALGRGFRPEEIGPDARPLVVLSHKLWKRLGADPEIVGSEIMINASRVPVIGVMPPDFQFSVSSLGGLLLVAMGLFGMIAGSVARRRGELAVRMALGASHGRVIWLVVAEGSRLLATGLIIGIPGIYVAGQTLEGFLVGISPFDIPTLAGVAVGLVAVALLACYMAARRVTSIEPDRLLREGG